MIAIILAGGGGTRLWPISTQDFPKQFLHFGDHKSLLQKTVERCLDSPMAEEIVISTNAQLEPLVRQQVEKMDSCKKIHIVIEPLRKNTGPAIGLAVRYVEEKLGRGPKSTILVMPSDHLIEPQAVFVRHLEEIESMVQDGKIALFGIRPTRAETGYGYIQIGEKAGAFGLKVRKFIEKPDIDRATQFLASGDYYWNAGMFGFTIETFWNELNSHAPQIAALRKESFAENVKRFYMQPDISIDYALIEKSQNSVVCPLPVTWSDIGSWDSLYETMEKDQNQNVIRGNVCEVETKRCLIFGNKRLISTVGLEDVVVVETEDAIFITKRGESQKVKQLLQELIRKGAK